MHAVWHDQTLTERWEPRLSQVPVDIAVLDCGTAPRSEEHAAADMTSLVDGADLDTVRTLIIRDLDHAPEWLQATILNFLRRTAVPLVVATASAELPKDLRSDLAVLFEDYHIAIPPLREHVGDIYELASHVIGRLQAMNAHVVFDADALDAATWCSWPESCCPRPW